MLPVETRWLSREVHTLYQLLFQQMRMIVEQVGQEMLLSVQPMLELLHAVAVSFTERSNQWVGLAHLATAEPYIQSHPINVTLLALALGRGQSYDTEQLTKLATKAYLHDLGMIQHADLVSQPRRLTEEELQQIHHHTEATVELVKRLLPEIDRTVRNALGQEHERYDGSGYPQHLLEEQIDVDMRIIGVVDVYEALTHQRSWRASMTPREAIGELLSERMYHQFDPAMIRLLIAQVGIYPVGSWVTLSTGEGARVLAVNIDSPVRPCVEVAIGTTGQPLKALREVDLSQYPSVTIRDYMSRLPAHVPRYFPSDME